MNALAEAVARQSKGTTATPSQPAVTIDDLLAGDDTRTSIADALGIPADDGRVDRYLRVLRSAPLDDPMLLMVPSDELLNAYIRVAQLGLEPNTTLQHCFLRAEPITGTELCGVEFILGYKGMITLAHRSPEIESLEAHVVRDKDGFEFDQGTESFLMHNWEIDKPRGDPKGYYGMVRYPGAARPRFWPISLDEIAEHRAESRNPDGPNSLWVTRPVQMALKTVIRIVYRELPVDPVALEATALDGQVLTGADEPAAA